MIRVQRIIADIYVNGKLFVLSNREVNDLTSLTPDEFKESVKADFEELGIASVGITLIYTQL